MKQKILPYFWPYTKGLKRFFALAVLAAFFSILFSFLTPQIIRLTVDSVIGEEPFALPGPLMNALEALGGRAALRSHLGLTAAAVLACALSEGLFTLSYRLLISHTTESYMKRLRDAIFRHIQHLPFRWHTQNRTGDIIQRCTSDMDIIRNFVANQMIELIRIVILASTALFLMSRMNGTLTLVALVFIPLIAGYSGIFFSILSKKFRVADESEGDLMVNVQENLTGVRVVRAFGREKQELDRFDKANLKLYDLWVDMGYTMGAYWGIGDLVTGLQVMTVIAVGALLAYRGQLTLGEFLAFVSYNRTLAFPLRRLGRILSDISKTRVSAERLAEIQAAEEERDAPDALAPDLRGDIVFDHVSFAYDGSDVLRDVSFTVPAGSTFGILGGTGSGKSTLCYLLDRLYDLAPDSGRITIGGVDIRDIRRDHLRENIGLVLQEPFLFSKTIAENIAVARPQSNMEQIRHAAAVADVDDSIQGFAHGYDTLVGERGVTLSGGQKQRVAIARTLLCGCPILVFDDSLSAVDLMTDARIRASLREDTGSATVLLISHRINTLMDADRILVLDNGRVAQLGTHEELLAQDGIYRRTYDLQSAAAGGTRQSVGRKEADA
ncbi:MAG: ABC transporter ATP-binding protein [Clostridia bacterium]|nr:ABC transporter ATP-binding protein [Clostridia bacterium]